jgi:glycine cleavage system H protein
MPKRKSQQTPRNKRPQQPQLLTRKEFLKQMGSVVGGTAIVSLALSSACGKTAKTTTSSKTYSFSFDPTSLPPSKDFVYQTPDGLPPEMPIPGCTTYVATDRKYTVEHMWVKKVAENIVAIGITQKMATLVDFIYQISLPKEGGTIEKGGLFGYVDSAKMDVELQAPISGTVLQVNTEVYTDLVWRINGDPYVKGWLVTATMSNPAEWDQLITPQEYSDLNAKVVE